MQVNSLKQEIVSRSKKWCLCRRKGDNNLSGIKIVTKSEISHISPHPDAVLRKKKNEYFSLLNVIKQRANESLDEIFENATQKVHLSSANANVSRNYGDFSATGEKEKKSSNPANLHYELVINR